MNSPHIMIPLQVQCASKLYYFSTFSNSQLYNLFSFKSPGILIKIKTNFNDLKSHKSGYKLSHNTVFHVWRINAQLHKR